MEQMELTDLIFSMELPIQLPELERTVNFTLTLYQIKSLDQKHLGHGLPEFHWLARPVQLGRTERTEQMELMDLIFLMELPIQLPELVRTMNSISTRLRIKSSDRKHLVHGLLEFLLLVLRAPLLMLGDLPEIQEQLMEQILLEQQI